MNANILDILSLIFSIIGLIVSLISLSFVIFGIINAGYCSSGKRKRLEKKLAKKVALINPDIILAPDVNGIDIALEVIEQLKKNITFMPIALQDRRYAPIGFSGYSFRTSKYYVTLPTLPPRTRILIIDDVVFTGETLKKSTNFYMSTNEVFTAALIADSRALISFSIPDFYVVSKSNLSPHYRFSWR